MRDLSAPLHRQFLDEARAAARAGETERMRECIALALDFAPEAQREDVLLAAAELLPSVGPAGARAGSARARSLAAEEEGGAAGRDGAPPAGSARGDRPEPARGDGGRVSRAEDRTMPAAPGERPRAGRRRLTRLAAALVVLVVAGAAGLRRGWLPGLIDADPVGRARQALEDGDAQGALGLLEPLGREAGAEAWLVRATAYEAVGDTAEVVQALTQAAMRDADGGRWALEAGDRLARLGAVSRAADSYLFALTPLRTREERERIARAQERAGAAERARRVRRW